MYIRMFDQRVISLIEEIGKHHPHLIAILNASPEYDFYMQLSELAAACGVILHGDYTDKDIYEVCEKLTKRLVSMRTLIVVPDSVDRKE